jgi:hypothetical protein
MTTVTINQDVFNQAIESVKLALFQSMTNGTPFSDEVQKVSAIISQSIHSLNPAATISECNEESRNLIMFVAQGFAN